ncbi:MAG: hypothetical protein RB191_04875 [Terriglobia bacterium]|nr:hypothetical protein [Terriglobia bacterium]
MKDNRSQAIMASLLAAILIPKVQKLTGVKLDIDDIVDLMAASAILWHGLCAFIERYFPPPAPKAATPPFVQTQPEGKPV